MIAALTLLIAGTAPVSTVTGDFDRDGMADTARWIVGGGGAVTLVIQSRGRRYRIESQRFSDPYLAINRTRGRVKTACGKGYNLRCGPSDPSAVRLRGGELLYGQRESSGFVVLWNGKRFRAVQLSD